MKAFWMGKEPFLRAKGTVLRTFWMGKEPFLRTRGTFLRAVGTILRVMRNLASRAANGVSLSGLSKSGSVFGFSGDLLVRLWIMRDLGLILLLSSTRSFIAAVAVAIGVATPMAKTFRRDINANLNML